MDFDFTAEAALNLVIENNETIIRSEECDIYLEIIQHIKNCCKQGKLFTEIPINRSKNMFCNKKITPIPSDELANKIMIFLRKRNFNCKIKYFGCEGYLTTFKNLKISW